LKTILASIILMLSIAISPPAMSEGAANQLGGCMVDSLNGKERKELAKWIFFAIAAHPEIRSYTSISSEDINTSDKVVGELI